MTFSKTELKKITQYALDIFKRYKKGYFERLYNEFERIEREEEIKLTEKRKELIEEIFEILKMNL